MNKVEGQEKAVKRIHCLHEKVDNEIDLKFHQTELDFNCDAVHEDKNIRHHLASTIEMALRQPKLLIFGPRKTGHSVVLSTLRRYFESKLHPRFVQSVILFGVQIVENHMQCDNPKRNEDCLEI